eukprot:3420240-Rhodomonas_salina.2
MRAPSRPLALSPPSFPLLRRPPLCWRRGAHQQTQHERVKRRGQRAQRGGGGRDEVPRVCIDVETRAIWRAGAGGAA